DDRLVLCDQDLHLCLDHRKRRHGGRNPPSAPLPLRRLPDSLRWAHAPRRGRCDPATRPVAATEPRRVMTPRGFFVAQPTTLAPKGPLMHDDLEPPEYAAALHLLTGPGLSSRTAAYVKDGDFDWPGLLVETERRSGGEALLGRIAHELWHAQKDVGLWEIPRRLDPLSF